MDFDGNNDYVNCSDTPTLDISGTAITISAWIAPDFTQITVTNEKVVDKRGSDNTDAYRLTANFGAKDWRFLITTNTGTTALDTQGVTWAVDEWHYLTAVYNGSYAKIYWDGLENNSAIRTGSITTTDYPLIIGYQPGGPPDSYFDGTIDEVRISDAARSAAWIKASYESERDDLLDFGGEGDATETLRPSGPTTQTGLSRVGDDANWKCVDEAGTHDGDSTYVYNEGPSGQATDLYQTQNHTTGTGTINNITIHYVARRIGSYDLETRATIRTHSNTYYGSYNIVTSSWVEYTETWTNNPFTSSAWTWQEIDELEIGIELEWFSAAENTRCTQLWVVVNYPSPQVETTPHFDFKYYSDWGGPSEDDGVGGSERG